CGGEEQHLYRTRPGCHRRTTPGSAPLPGPPCWARSALVRQQQEAARTGSLPRSMTTTSRSTCLTCETSRIAGLARAGNPALLESNVVVVLAELLTPYRFRRVGGMLEALPCRARVTAQGSRTCTRCLC